MNVTKGKTWATGETVTATLLNSTGTPAVVPEAADVDGSTIEVNGSTQYAVKDGGITTAKLASKTGADTTVCTGTAGTDTYVPKWNADGDLVDGYAFLDDDTMGGGTPSDTAVASQQSVKAYVDNGDSFTESHTSNGYVAMPNGTYFQWGKVSIAANTTSAVTFPTAFPTACLQVITGYTDTSDLTIVDCSCANNITASGFNLTNGDGSTQTVNWFAIGH